ncbi:MAG: serine/threonine-protein kinase [Rhodothermales bacterium]
MDAVRWKQIQTLFSEVLEQPPRERDSFLEEACSGDPDLLAELRSLLEADADAYSLLDSSAVNALALPADLLPEGVLPAAGERVGPYRLVRRLGVGGMGTVYLAERADGQFEQTVALKLIKPGMDTEAVLARFQAERQILAQLDHPNIARLLDGGAGQDGRPYFAMEYVAGETVTDYCDARALSVAERLRLFEDVCAAVAYAHQNLVVHRDLKPSNVLVTEAGDGRPQVKLLDFGIAKLLTGEDEMALTRTGQRVLTPAYAAPEQLGDQAITTATDVYGLGVVLYELLVGRRPFEDLTRDALEEAVLQTDPVRPSVAVGQTSESVAEARSATSERLKRRLRGDLDTVVLKALEKEPARRYASAEGLLADLRREREGVPILARPTTVGYRIRKFVARHRGGVVAAVAIVLVLASVIAAYTNRLARERDRAQLEAEKATEVAAFLGGIFQSADPNDTQGDSALVRDVLDRGAARIRTELAGQPEVQASLMQVVGEVYTTLERYDQADSLLSAALVLKRALYPPAHEEIAATLVSLALLYDYTGDYAASDSLHQEALAMRRRLLGPNHPGVAEAMHGLAAVQYRNGHYAEADSLFKATLHHFGLVPHRPQLLNDVFGHAALQEQCPPLSIISPVGCEEPVWR